MRRSEKECETWNTPRTITEIPGCLGMSQRITLDRLSFEQVLCAPSLLSFAKQSEELLKSHTMAGETNVKACLTGIPKGGQPSGAGMG